MNIQDLLPTDYAIEYIEEFSTQVCATDFIGYLFDLKCLGHRGFKGVGGAIDTFGKFRIYSLNKKQIKNKRAIKIYKRLLKLGFLEFPNEPFPEFTKRQNINLNPEKSFFIEEPLFRYAQKEDSLHGYGNQIVFSDTEELNEQETH